MARGTTSRAGPPRGVRNNNPGNIRPGGTHGDAWRGQSPTQTDSGFLQFNSPHFGIRALARTLMNYQAQNHLRTIAQIVSRWAPPTDHNNTPAYIADVARRLNLDPNQPINLETNPELLSRLTAAIIHHENGSAPGGRDWYSADEVRAAVIDALDRGNHGPAPGPGERGTPNRLPTPHPNPPPRSHTPPPGIRQNRPRPAPRVSQSTSWKILPKQPTPELSAGPMQSLKDTTIPALPPPRATQSTSWKILPKKPTPELHAGPMKLLPNLSLPPSPVDPGDTTLGPESFHFDNDIPDGDTPTDSEDSSGGGQLAARISDQHDCPLVTASVPHKGGPVSEGSPNVIIQGEQAARVGDFLICDGDIDAIASGSSTVYINGKQAARVTDATEHGGVLASGASLVHVA